MVIATLLIISIPSAFSATPKVGGSCTKVNQFHESKSALLVCATAKGKKTWRKASSVERALHLREKNRLIQAAAQKIINDAETKANQIISQANAAAANAAAAAANAAAIAASKAAADAKAAAETVADAKAEADAKAAAIAAANAAAAAAAAAEAARQAANQPDCNKNPSKIKVGLAFDIGGRGDKSFNDSAAAGLDLAIAALCVTSKEVTTSNGSDSDREQQLYFLAQAGYNPIIAVGFLYAGPIKKVASDYPNVQFAIVDDASVDRLNVAGLVFAEEQGSYLAGVAAALASKSGKIGYIGGVRIPLLQKFEAGFVAGVKATNPAATVDVRYVTEPPDFGGFNDPAKAKIIAKGMIDKGVDVIYSVAGGSGAGNFAAAADAAKAGKKVWTIGVDSDQYLTASAAERENMLTSMVKRIDVAVFDVVEKAISGSSINDLLDSSGIYGRRYGVLRSGVTLSRSGGFIEGYLQEILRAENRIKSGEIVVPTKP
jgi:basic membrane protein A